MELSNELFAHLANDSAVGALVALCGYLLRRWMFDFSATQKAHGKKIAELGERVSYVEGEISKLS